MSQLHRTSATQGFLAGILLCNSGVPIRYFLWTCPQLHGLSGNEFSEYTHCVTQKNCFWIICAIMSGPIVSRDACAIPQEQKHENKLWSYREKFLQRGFCTSGTRIWGRILGNEFWTPKFRGQILGLDFLLLLFQQKRAPEKVNLEKFTSQNPPFALFCALLGTCVCVLCAHLRSRSFACFCIWPRLERPRLGTSELCDEAMKRRSESDRWRRWILVKDSSLRRLGHLRCFSFYNQEGRSLMLTARQSHPLNAHFSQSPDLPLPHGLAPS